MPQEFAGGNHESAVIGDRFQLGCPPTILARTASIGPIGFTRLKSDGASLGRTKDVPAENAYLFHVQLQPAAVDMLIDGKRWPATTGENCRTATTYCTISEATRLPKSIHRSTISGFIFPRPPTNLPSIKASAARRDWFLPALGSDDRVMYGLAHALLDHVEYANERSALFIDHVALTFAHIMSAYGNAAVPDGLTLGGLSPWQLRRVLDFLSAHLSDDPTVAELARECGLSSGYFARAFRQTTGVTPHQWLIKIERARQLLLGNGLGLADIALVCGFVDQSHFTRVFAKLEGDSPGRWRQRHHKPRR